MRRDTGRWPSARQRCHPGVLSIAPKYAARSNNSSATHQRRPYTAVQLHSHADERARILSPPARLCTTMQRCIGCLGRIAAQRESSACDQPCWSSWSPSFSLAAAVAAVAAVQVPSEKATEP